MMTQPDLKKPYPALRGGSNTRNGHPSEGHVVQSVVDCNDRHSLQALTSGRATIAAQGTTPRPFVANGVFSVSSACGVVDGLLSGWQLSPETMPTSMLVLLVVLVLSSSSPGAS